MWYLPLNHPLSSHTATDLEDLKEALHERLDQPEPLLTWKSKPLSSKTFWLAWKRVYWFRHLCGRMLKPSMQGHFAEKYTASLAAIPVSHSPVPENETDTLTLDTCGRILSATLQQLDLFGASLKTSAATSPWASMKFTKAYGAWAMQLRQESLQRRKLAHLMSGSDFTYSHWPTATVSSGDYQNVNRDKNGVSRSIALTLRGAVKNHYPTPNAAAATQGQNQWDGKRGQTLLGAARGQNWATPMAQDHGGSVKDFSPKLSQQVKNWSTPLVHDSKISGTSVSRLKRQTQELAAQVQNWATPISSNYTTPAIHGQGGSNLQTQIVGQPAKDNSSTPGSLQEQLNPAWSILLMGTTLERTFFVPLATE